MWSSFPQNQQKQLASCSKCEAISKWEAIRHANGGGPDLPVSADQWKTGPDAENQAWSTKSPRLFNVWTSCFPIHRHLHRKVLTCTGKCPLIWKVSGFTPDCCLCFKWSWVPSSHQRDAFFVRERQHCFHLLLAFCSFFVFSLLCYVQRCTILKTKKMLISIHTDDMYSVVLGVCGSDRSDDAVDDLLLYILLRSSRHNLHDDPLMMAVFTLLDIVIVQIICCLCCNFLKPQ